MNGLLERMDKMVKIFLPTMAANINDVRTMMDLLEKTVAGKYPIGLEIIGKPEHFQKEEYLNQIKENMMSFSGEIVVHGFSFIQVYESGLANMSTKVGKQLLDTYVALADDIGATYVHVHGGAGYKISISDKQSREELEKIRNNLLSVFRTDIKIGVENVPTPSMGDVEKNPTEVWHDCLESLSDCLIVVHNTGLKITYDTCHYAAGLQEDGEIDLITPLEDLKQYLHHLHISDVVGHWVPNKSTWTESIIPGNGRIGKKSFENFFSWIKGNCPDIGICVEVVNADFKNPVESEESIKRILKWLE